MLSESLSTDVLAFLRAHIESYEHLAILLLVFRERLRGWSEGELVDMLRIPPQLATSALRELCGAGLLRVVSEAPPGGAGPSGRYQYACAGATDATIARLALAYTENPVQVVKALNANAIEKVRASALRAFADSFVLQKKDGEDA
jgi:hypothetical protein